MYAVIFEVQPKTELAAQNYFDLAAELRTELEEIDGFISVERFSSLSDEEKFLSISFWRRILSYSMGFPCFLCFPESTSSRNTSP